ncbi:unnamed protein product [Polarella glacialis]|uniref:Calmodulin n=1 Tax=Polarella glacialis TaxID=89957 RepID=A0A813JL44_POLGL|nr:unnamed protein product [Polarella glacialis]
MNATSTTELIVQQLVCSTYAQDILTSNKYGTALLTQGEIDKYMCDCCLSPCAKCEGSLMTGGDLTSPAGAASIMSGKMGDLTGAGNAGNLFSPSGANGDMFTNMWSEATKYFNSVCMPNCNNDFATMNNTGDYRTWSYAMAQDNDMYDVWGKLKANGPQSMKDMIKDNFVFKALPLSACPYPASKCIPMPGVQFEELTNGYCSFEMAADVMNSVGSAAGEVFATLGGESMENAGTESFGSWCGDFMNSIDTFIVVSMISFVISILFMLILRWTVGFCVWFAVFMIFVAFLLGGGASWVKSFQCAGASIFETGNNAAVATAIAASTAASNAASGTKAADETLTGDGADYTGVQYRTNAGYRCINWGTTNTSAEKYTVPPYSNLAENYCRNPYLTGDKYPAATIWCYTNDEDVRWQECTPIGTIRPVCKLGYSVPNEQQRKALEIIGYVLWGLAGVYFILVCCFTNRIRLAVAVNKVAATFIGHTPRIILVPIVQSLIGICWVLAWACSVSFLVSQVPDGYTPKAAYASYAEAYGTEDTPGKCTDKWPTGSVYKDDDSCVLLNATSGIYGCWKCAPPRYVFDARFAGSFFVFLWNNALLIATGQCIIAGAVGVWFFTPNSEKGNRPAIKTAIWNVLRYHLGSVAFGSFIIAVIQFIRWLMYYYEQQAKAQKNRVLVMILKALQCIIWCFEKCVQFLNKNAYIQIALMGTNFCTSAKKAFFLILRNALRFGTVAMLGQMIHAIGFLFITSATVGIGYLILSAMHPDISPGIPLVVYCFMSYVVSMLFMNVFGLAVDTTLQLACRDGQLAGEQSRGAAQGGFHRTSSEHKLEFAFSIYDVNKDGYISNGDLFAVMKMMVGDNLGETQLQQLVDRQMVSSDRDGDGKLSFAEFKDAVENIGVAEQLSIDLSAYG